MRLTHFSLFTGIGGIDLAAEWAGFETVGQVEWEDYQTKVLEKHWPNVNRWRDVRNVTIESIRERGIENITLLSGGFPCQPHSLAGKRRASDDERDLWGEVARLISEIKPRWFLGENVPGLLSSEDGRFFGRVLNDLAEVGYNVGWCSFPASAVGAIHQRERVFIIVYSGSLRYMGKQFKEFSEERRKSAQQELRSSITGATNTNSEYVEGSCKDTIQGFETLQGKLSTRSVEEWRERSTIYQPKLCRNYNGIPNQVDRLKCLGNAVVPQQVYPILQTIADIEKHYDN
ncbi:DNA cytosine methyltransferase [Brassicibacter mesophilus]|uniref:DNA cytosine methyltransferase n=1 Tax=Brassicibacter mesophilus TaxID=745119 RepID=UPI003D23B3B7